MSEIAKIKGYDIRDKKLADATSASSVASTDAIRMKTTTGDEVYIDRDSFVGAIASVFKANNSSTITSLFGELTANNDSTPCSINMSNLASVLGAQKESSSTVDLDTILNTCVYDITATSDWEARHLPVYGHGLCYTFANTSDAADYAGMQFYVCSNGLYVRKEWTYKSWSPWINIL